MSRVGILFISYNGMLEPLGQSQVLAYQEKLATDHRIFLVSFERSSDWANATERAKLADRMARAGIEWHPLRYHKRLSFLSTAWDILAGAICGLGLTRRHGLSIVHARSYVPAAMALIVKWLAGARFIFDMRGFWADERVDGGLWPSDGGMYQLAKWLERKFLQNADHVVSLTKAGVRQMEAFPYLQGRMPPMTVIPTCADLDRFRPPPDQAAREFLLGYVGSAGTWYLFDETVASFAKLRQLRPDARLLIINRGEHAYIRERLAAGGIPGEAFELRSAIHAEVPAQMARMRATAFFIKPAFSKQASAPTKLGEFLGCGVPSLSNAGVGDMAEILEQDRVGVAIRGFDAESIEIGVRRMLALLEEPGIRERCVATAKTRFSLDVGVTLYRDIYASLRTSP